MLASSVYTKSMVSSPCVPLSPEQRRRMKEVVWVGQGPCPSSTVQYWNRCLRQAPGTPRALIKCQCPELPDNTPEVPSPRASGKYKLSIPFKARPQQVPI